jgi:cobalt-zinc-cadmium efflux system membrane fusion protein
LLAQISSPELTTSQLTYLRASAALSLAERAVDRAKQMIQADVISSAEFQKRESELSIARAEQRAAEDQLRLLGLPGTSIDRLRDQGRIQPEGDVRAKQGGVVVERKVSAGQVVQPGDSLFTVADLSSVWAVASLPEQAARYVSKNQTVAIEIPSLDASFKGEIVFISDTVQPETRTVAIRTQLSNPKRDIKPMMLMNMKVESNGKMVPLIPNSAVVRDNDRDHVFVQTQPRIFRLTPVELEPAVEGNRPVLKGVTQGEMVVTEGAFHLNNDRVQRLLTSQPAAPKSGSKPQAAK